MDADLSLFQEYGLPGTCLYAVLAVQALFLIPQHLYIPALAFRIGTPRTVQRTSFHKDNGPDSRSVIDTEFLYVEDNSCCTAVCRHGSSSFDQKNPNTLRISLK